ncbi:hypothetical protein FIV01_00130 [Vibrio aquimaris]|uniref:Uncharacterized protein n=1 Tax=Vibrio aquimaris TaxID=2587862 RepID=A0A5P9CH37_9VIBR|nr:hypothetical protein FIV01_00130 [Vibrio aquimaris]
MKSKVTQIYFVLYDYLLVNVKQSNSTGFIFLSLVLVKEEFLF